MSEEMNARLPGLRTKYKETHGGTGDEMSAQQIKILIEQHGSDDDAIVAAMRRWVLNPGGGDSSGPITGDGTATDGSSGGGDSGNADGAANG